MSLHSGTLGSLLSTHDWADQRRSFRQMETPAFFSPVPGFKDVKMLQALIPQTREEALHDAPGRPVIMLRPAPVKVRSIIGSAIAYTVTHVLVEWDAEEEHHLRWEANCLVHRLQ